MRQGASPRRPVQVGRHSSLMSLLLVWLWQLGLHVRLPAQVTCCMHCVLGCVSHMTAACGVWQCKVWRSSRNWCRDGSLVLNMLIGSAFVHGLPIAPVTGFDASDSHDKWQSR